MRVRLNILLGGAIKLAKVETLGANKIKLTIEVSAEDFAEALQRAYLKNRGRFSIQGFRKGKAPKPVIESHYGEGVFFEDAFDIVFPDSYQKAVKECDLEPVSNPKLDVSDMGKQQGIVYTAQVYIKPEVKLGEYKGVKAELVTADITEKQVDEEIARIADRNARWVEADRAAQYKDKVIIDYAGSVDGEPFEGGAAENQAIEIGSDTFIPGFEEQLVGMKKGEEKDVRVKFPDDYRAERLAGKNAVFHVTLHDVKQKEIPELDDEFAQDVSEFDTMEQYRADVKEKLVAQAEKQAKTATENNVLAAVVKNTDIDVPECMIENQIDNQIRQLEYSMMYQGIKLSDYLKMTDTKIEDVRERYKQGAEEAVRTQLTIEAVMKAEGLEATEEQVRQSLEKRAEQAKKDVNEYKKDLSEDALEYIKENLAYDNTVSFLVENAALQAPKKKDKKGKPEKENTSGE